MAATDHTRLRTARAVAREKSTDNSQSAADGTGLRTARALPIPRTAPRHE
jgi:hypothetical protein